MLFALLLACHHDDPTPTAETGAPAGSAFEPSAPWDLAANDWEPYNAVDPGSAWVYQVTTRQVGTNAYLAFRGSADGGVTWGADRQVGDPTYQWDPFVAVAADTGCVFVEWLVPIEPWRTFVVSSCDHGATFSDPVDISDWSSDHGWMVVSPDGQDVYVAFNGTAPGNPEDEWQAAVVASHDGGATFGPPFVVGDGGALYWFQTGGAIAPDGTVYFAAAEYTHDYRGEAQIGVWRSVDDGATFDVVTVDAVQEPPPCDWAKGCEYGFLAPQAAVAVDAAGAVLLLSQGSDTAEGHQQMEARVSAGGAAWEAFSDPVALGPVGADNGFPSAAAGLEPGDFRVAWQANTAAEPSDWNTWYQRTTDGGATWLPAPVRLSDPLGTAAYRDPNGYRFPYGDYLSIAVDGDGRDHVIWGEGRSYNGPGGTWFTRTAD